MEEFLRGPDLSTDDRVEVLAAMTDVKKNGRRVARHLRGEIYEVRADCPHASYRVLFAAEGSKGRVLLALTGFSKKTQRTPHREIALAERRLADWRKRRSGA